MERGRKTRWLVLASLLVAAFAGTVVTLNLTLYSASGFVGSYLNALARHDAAGALALPGVDVPPGAQRQLLSPRALGDLEEIELVSDVDRGGGRHTVTYSYLAGDDRGSTTFEVRHTGPRLGLFSGWTFETSPIAPLTITPLHEPEFTVNELDVVSAAGAGVPTAYSVLSPGAYVLGHSSRYFTAPELTTVVDGTDAVAAEVDIQANAAFVKAVQKQLDDYLDDCVTQKVLLPTGCPMGKQIADRIQDEPTWSMVAYPVVTIVPAEEPGTWAVPSTPGSAHLTVTVKSIFDGTISTFDQDVPFTVRYLITFPPDGTLLITAQYD
jgi:hypothetical protein